MIPSFGLLVVIRVVSVSFGMNAEERLIRKLFDENRYDKRARPVSDIHQPVNISFRLDFNHLYDVSELTQTVTILTDVYQRWHDNRLYWNASGYDDMIRILVDGDLLWTPDTTLYNGVEMYRPSVEDEAKAIITPVPESETALVNYFYNSRHAIGCHFDVRYFPFDTQICTFIFGSWNHDVSLINYYLEDEAATMEYHEANDVWSVVSFDMRANKHKYTCCTHPFVVISAHLVMKRKSMYYLFNLFFPTIVINVLSTGALFASKGTPENRHDKISVGLTALLSYCILLLSMSDQIPKGSTSVPLLGIFYVIVMMQNGLELLVAIHLSYPERRARALSVLDYFHLKVKRCFFIWKKASERNRNGSIAMTANESHIDSGQLELFCMIVAICTTVIITGVVFEVGYNA